MPHPEEAVTGIAADRAKDAASRPVAPSPANAAVLRTAADFVAAIERLGPRGGTLTVGGDADLALGPIDLRGMGRWILQPEAGPATSRPRLRFRPGPIAPNPSARRPSLFTVRSGGLEIQGVDVVLEEAEVPAARAGRRSAIGPGAELTLSRSTVTALQADADVSILAVLGDDGDRALGIDAGPAQFRASDCLLRSGGDVIEVASGRGVQGDAHERRRRLPRRPDPRPRGGAGPRAEGIDLSLRQVTARVAGGLAFLESSAAEPELPAASISARDAILTTDGMSAPLIRVDGQEGLEALRDRVSWEGSGVVYHKIQVYRVDQSARTGRCRRSSTGRRGTSPSRRGTPRRSAETSPS